MNAGHRDTLVTLQAYTTTQDAAGEEVKTHTELGQEWAQVFYGRGDERRQAAMEQGQQAATFNMLSNEVTRQLRIKHKIVADGSDWDITSIAPIGRDTIEATAVRLL